MQVYGKIDGAASERAVRPLAHPLSGEFSVPGDKSLSHRALLLASMARSASRLRGLLDSWDVRSTFDILRQLGVSVSGSWDDLRLQGWGDERRAGPLRLDCGNSGTAMRLLSGVLAAGQGEYILSGDASLNSRPMRRIIGPLRAMGVDISGSAGFTAPLVLRSQSRLRAIEWTLPMASAQVKSCILLAGVQAEGETVIFGDGGSRDHTERLLTSLGVSVAEADGIVRLQGPARWDGFQFCIPGDLSSAAFLAALALLVPGSDIRIKGVNLNPTRLGFFRLAQRMGADLSWQERGAEMGEPWGDLQVRFSVLNGIEIAPDEVPGCQDELMLLAVLASAASGVTSVSGAGELRCKESNRLAYTVRELRRLGADICELEDGWRVRGPVRWQSGRVTTHGDHRLEMSLAAAALAASPPRETLIENTGWSAVSWPHFWENNIFARQDVPGGKR